MIKVENEDTDIPYLPTTSTRRLVGVNINPINDNKSIIITFYTKIE